MCVPIALKSSSSSPPSPLACPAVRPALSVPVFLLSGLCLCMFLTHQLASTCERCALVVCPGGWTSPGAKDKTDIICTHPSVAGSLLSICKSVFLCLSLSLSLSMSVFVYLMRRWHAGSLAYVLGDFVVCLSFFGPFWPPGSGPVPGKCDQLRSVAIRWALIAPDRNFGPGSGPGPWFLALEAALALENAISCDQLRSVAISCDQLRSGGP